MVEWSQEWPLSEACEARSPNHSLAGRGYCQIDRRSEQMIRGDGHKGKKGRPFSVGPTASYRSVSQQICEKPEDHGIISKRTSKRDQLYIC